MYREPILKHSMMSNTNQRFTIGNCINLSNERKSRIWQIFWFVTWCQSMLQRCKNWTDDQDGEVEDGNCDQNQQVYMLVLWLEPQMGKNPEFISIFVSYLRTWLIKMNDLSLEFLEYVNVAVACIQTYPPALHIQRKYLVITCPLFSTTRKQKW